MWFDNPFAGKNPDNLALLLKNLGLKQGYDEKKRSTTVDVWRGNYETFVKPAPKITIIKKYGQQAKDDIAEVKTLYPENPTEPSPRTLLCHQATEESGHVTCDHPGKCSNHRLVKPSAFEVSKLDECRTVIDLYQQGVMNGVINADNQISRDSDNQRYSKVEYRSGGDCTSHTACAGSCAIHQAPASTSPAMIKSPHQPSTRPAHNKQVVTVARDPGGRQRARSASPDARRSGNHVGNQVSRRQHVGEKHVRFRDQVLVKCGCAHRCNCGWTAIPGPVPACEVKRVACDTSDGTTMPSPQDEGVQESSCDVEVDGRSGEKVKLLPPCYYQHARQRMKRLKEKSKTIVEKTYSAPSSLARPKSESLIKKYNSAKQTSIKRQRFAIPNVSPDTLYQPTKPKRRPKSAPVSEPDRYYNNSWTLPPPSYRIEGYQEGRRGGSQDCRRGRGKKRREDTIKVAVDEIGPLVYAVQNGEIVRMKVDSTVSGPNKCQMII